MKQTIHILTLEHRTDRQASIIKESVNQDFSIKFFYGERSLKRVDNARCISTGHKKIIQYAKDNNLPEIIIAEDDLFFYGDDGKAFKYFIDNKPKSFDLYIGCLYNGDISEQGKVLNGMSGSHSLYIISSKFYNFALHDVPDNCFQDRYLGDHAHKFDYFVCNPMVCGQTGGYSDNQKKTVVTYEMFMENRNVYGR